MNSADCYKLDLGKYPRAAYEPIVSVKYKRSYGWSMGVFEDKLFAIGNACEDVVQACFDFKELLLQAEINPCSHSSSQDVIEMLDVSLEDQWVDVTTMPVSVKM